MSECAIAVEHLSVQFGDHKALDDLSLRIPQNDFVAIVGPNGAGKTTFLKVLLGLVRPTSGVVRIFDRAP